MEDSQTINHHGKSLKVEDGKVITVSEVGEGQSVGITPLETDHRLSSFDFGSGWGPGACINGNFF